MNIYDIIEELKQNNHAHFDDFYNQTNRQIYFSAVSVLKNHAAAEDIMQETYVSFLNNIDQYKKGYNIFAYLSVISRNLAVNMFNKDKRTIQSDDILHYETAHHDNYSDSSIKAILDLLDDDTEKEIVTYHAIFDYKFKDIAKIIKKPLGTVLWVYNKAIKKLKERIGDYYEK